MFSGSVLLPGGDATGDGKLRTSDGRSFEVQRAYLSIVSPYFAALFSEAFGAEKDVLLSRVSAAVFDTLLTFQYTGKIWQRSNEFVNTPGWLMYELLSSPELNVQREEHVLHAIAKWWMSGSSAAALDGNVLRQLLQCVRIGRCDKE
ncbi:hypothetical protein HPB52_003176 [Rhipicephalus sanguineus]|uniref:BTB domain-containing protein n=2 Tax=Rhipicephalus sanguineus TaxID=34632 RepID=A0A9D4SZZ3_RHISA|nr:hypothetical protein HPB52_003176 [Rhipicephalus sanguineus]